MYKHLTICVFKTMARHDCKIHTMTMKLDHNLAENVDSWLCFKVAFVLYTGEIMKWCNIKWWLWKWESGHYRCINAFMYILCICVCIGVIYNLCSHFSFGCIKSSNMVATDLTQKVKRLTVLITLFATCIIKK